MSLDREIEDLLAVDPSPEFLAKVRRRIEAEPQPGAAWHSTWKLVPIGALALASAMAVTMWPSTNDAIAPVAPAADRALASVAPRPLTRNSAVAPVAPVAPTSRRAIAPALAPPEPEILLSEAESRAIASLLERVRSGRMTPVTQSEDEQTAEPSWVEIEPVVIAPMARITPVEGDRQ